jgi:hypothetical protein
MQSFKQYLQESIKLTLQYHDFLNKKIWESDQPVKGIKEYLIKHSYEFARYSGIPKEKIKDIVMTGGNANFNYTKYSDIDVHLLCDITEKKEDSLYTKKAEWTKEHPEIKFAGYPVEYYIQADKEHFPDGQGVYSLLQNKWLIVPKHLDKIAIMSDPNVRLKIEHQIAIIKQLLKTGSRQDILDYKEKLWRMRSEGLEKAGEFSVGNCVYKDLRNRGLVDKLNNHLDSMTPKKKA